MITIFNCENNIKDLFKITIQFLFNYFRKESGLKEFIKNKYQSHNFIEFFCTGRSALYSILKSINLKKGFRVGIQAFNCVVVPKAIIESGGLPVYLDIEEDTLSINYSKLGEKIDELDIVIIQYTYGLIPKHILKIVDLCKKKNKLIILDKAHCILKNVPVNNYFLENECHGIFYSTDHTKSINAVKGGIAICKSNLDSYYINTKEKKFVNTFLPFAFETIFYYEKLYFINRIIRFFMKLFKQDYMFSDIKKIKHLINLKPSLFWEYCVFYQIKREFIRSEKIKKHFFKLQSILESSLLIEFNPNIKFDSIPMRIPIICKNETDKKIILNQLKKNKILVSDWFPRPLTCFPEDYHKYFYNSKLCPKAEEISSKIIGFPCGKRFRQKYVYKILKNIL